MKLAIIAPSPVPFVMGGAENLWLGLLAAFNRMDSIQADLIKLPSPERNAAEIIASYQNFSLLDLRHFDQVISTKYPAWMIDHPNHVVYMQHKLRGLYDTYPADLSINWQEDCPLPIELQRLLLLDNPDRKILPELFDRLQQWLLANPEHAAMQLPGPLLRAIVHQLDRIALAPNKIIRYLAISNTVKQREGYFPVDVPVKVIHHPTSLITREALADETIFTASRLDGAKRIDLLIKAYKHAGLEIPFHIAGNGPAEAELKELAAGSPSIRFLGRISEERLVEEYRRALFVPFVPYQEDYGLITLEAMQSGKPVVTVTDAGGVNELVQHGFNGYVVKPDVGSLAAVFTEYVANPSLAKIHGEHARSTVAHIDWTLTARQLLNRPAHRCKVVVANTFPIYPPQSGGQLRIYHLYRQLSKYADVTVVSLCHTIKVAERRQLGDHFSEIRVPRSAALLEFDAWLENEVGISAGDLSVALLPNLVPEFIDTLRDICTDAHVAITSHCYGFTALQQAVTCPIWYDAHNVEYDLKAAMYPSESPWLAAIFQLEYDCLHGAVQIFACSQDDANRFQQLYGVESSRLNIAPNGIDIASTPYTSQLVRKQARIATGITRPTLLFMGSMHQPNVEAALLICDMAVKYPQWDFLLMGTVCHNAELRHDLANLFLLGLVSEVEKQKWLACVDIGLNPMMNGSGTNLKILEYAASGVPIVSTKFGARGGILLQDQHLWVSEPSGLAGQIEEVLALDLVSREQRCHAARQQVETMADWAPIAKSLATCLYTNEENDFAWRA